MSTIARKQFATGLQGVQQMEGADRAAGAVRFLTIVGEYQRGTTVALHHASGGNADDATMPAVTVDHHAISVVQRRLLFEAGLDGFENPTLFLLAFSIELVKS